jgi:DNA-binding MarR family transcriptional regulator
MYLTMDVTGPVSPVVTHLWARLSTLRRRLLSGMQGGLPALDALELTVPQAMTLFALVERGTLSISQLQAVSGRSQPATSHLVAQLARRGLVSKRHDPADARRALVQATAKATKFVRQVEGLRIQSFAAALERVPASVVTQFERALGDLLDAMEETS